MADYETSAVPNIENLACILYVTFHVQSAGLEGHIRTNSDILQGHSDTANKQADKHNTQRRDMGCRDDKSGIKWRNVIVHGPGI